MKVESKIIFGWPEMPPLPSVGQITLIRVTTSTFRPTARHELRAVLRQILAGWSGFLPEKLPLRETARGPVWAGQLIGHVLDISLAYANGESWIALLRGGFIGVDALLIQPVPEAEDVARLYLGRNAMVAIQQSYDPALAFAQAWTEFEAKLKCLKQEMNERSGSQEEKFPCFIQSWIFSGQRMVTVASRISTQF
jgi:hypothetical protein